MLESTKCWNWGVLPLLFLYFPFTSHHHHPIFLAWNHPVFFSLFSSLLLRTWIGVVQWKKCCIADVFSSFTWTRQCIVSDTGAERSKLTCWAMQATAALENKCSWSLHGALCGVGWTAQTQLSTGSCFLQARWTTTAWSRSLDWFSNLKDAHTDKVSLYHT